MTIVCYIGCALALLAALLVLTARNAMHALLYLVSMLLALAVVFFTLGAPFAAALEIVVYAGAIMVLFVFVIMMLNVSPEVLAKEAVWLRPGMWVVPVLFTTGLLVLSIYALSSAPRGAVGTLHVGPREVGLALFRPYLLGVELVSLLLLAGLVAAFHLAPQPRQEETEREEEVEEVEHVPAG